MATKLSVGPAQTRGFALSAYSDFDFNDFTSGVGAEVFRLPLGSTIIGGRISVTTVWDSGTSDGIEVGDATDDNRYHVSSDAQSAGNNDLLGIALGYAIVEADRAILVEVTSAGTAATTGAGNVLAIYADPDYNTINQDD